VIRYRARAAIIESAPQFLVRLIARFAAEDLYGTSAIDALGRLATAESRAELKRLFDHVRDRRRSAIVLSLARVGQRLDAEFFTRVLHDFTADKDAKGYAILGLGHIGGDRAAVSLERALPTMPPELLR